MTHRINIKILFNNENTRSATIHNTIHNTQEYLLNKGWCSECRFLVQNKVFPTPPPKKKKNFSVRKLKISAPIGTEMVPSTPRSSALSSGIFIATTYIVYSNFEETKVFYVNFFLQRYMIALKSLVLK